MITIKNYIDGSFKTSSNRKYIDIYNPSIGEIFATCPDSSREDLDIAIESSEASFDEWSSLKQDKRSAFLFSLADIIESELDKFAISESTDN